jgi:hypothetical protein
LARVIWNLIKWHINHVNSMFLVAIILKDYVYTTKAVNEYITKTTGFSPVFLCGKYDNVAMVFIQKRKTIFYWDFNVII